MTKRLGKWLKWNNLVELAFIHQKDHFTTPFILSHPNPEKPFIIEVDAFNTGIGAVISQRQDSNNILHECTFFSRKLNAAEQNYNVENRELLAMKAALEEWRHWLEGAKHKFTVMTDHKKSTSTQQRDLIPGRQDGHYCFTVSSFQ